MPDRSLEYVIEVLTEHNKWRRAETPYEKMEDIPNTSEELGIAINDACKYLKKLARIYENPQDFLDILGEVDD